MLRRIATLLLALVMGLAVLCGCDAIGDDGGVTPLDPAQSYTVEDQEMFSYEGLTVSVIGGTYSGDPDFHVSNTSEQNYWVSIDAVVYNDVCQRRSLVVSGSDICPAYKVMAGDDQPLKDCPMNYQVFDMTGGTLSSVSTSNKREYRFAVYRVTEEETEAEEEGTVDTTVSAPKPEEKGTVSMTVGTLKPGGEGTVSMTASAPKPEDRVYLSELILVRTSDYDENAMIYFMPGGFPLYEQDGISVWSRWLTYMNAGEGISVLGKTVSFSASNKTEKDVRIEFTVSPKETAEGEEAPSVILYTEILAGKNAMWTANAVNEENPDWITGKEELALTIRVYDQMTGELLTEQGDLTVAPENDLMQPINPGGGDAVLGGGDAELGGKDEVVDRDEMFGGVEEMTNVAEKQEQPE